jgi:hypothetical protein
MACRAIEISLSDIANSNDILNINPVVNYANDAANRDFVIYQAAWGTWEKIHARPARGVRWQ